MYIYFESHLVTGSARKKQHFFSLVEIHVKYSLINKATKETFYESYTVIICDVTLDPFFQVPPQLSPA